MTEHATTNDEETCLNRIGAEIMGWHICTDVGFAWHTWRTKDNKATGYKAHDGLPSVKLWNPCHDLNHTLLVEMAIDEKGWRFAISYFLGRVRVFMWRRDKRDKLTSINEYAPLKDLALCKMRAIGKAVESEGGK